MLLSPSTGSRFSTQANLWVFFREPKYHRDFHREDTAYLFVLMRACESHWGMSRVQIFCFLTFSRLRDRKFLVPVISRQRENRGEMFFVCLCILTIEEEFCFLIFRVFCAGFFRIFNHFRDFTTIILNERRRLMKRVERW